MYKSCLFLLYSIIAISAFSQQPFVFEGREIVSGSIEHFTIKVHHDAAETTIPVTVFHGKNNGPVLGLTAGVHGYEYTPILASQKLIKMIDPQELKGTIILVSIANMGSFLGRTPYINPIDHKNLNRSFPGLKKGSLTEQIAYFISQKVIARCDYFVDMHSGDAPEDLMPYVAYYQHDDRKQISKQGRAMASSMGFDPIIVFKTKGKSYMNKEEPSLYCSAEAFKRGIPAVDIECGRLGMVEDELTEKIVMGIERLLTHLEMAQEVAIAIKESKFIEKRSYLTSTVNGIFYPFKKSGEYVKKGTKIGHVTNFFGKSIQEVYADTNGIILYIIGTPPINKGETLCAIGVLK